MSYLNLCTADFSKIILKAPKTRAKQVWINVSDAFVQQCSLSTNLFVKLWALRKI